MKIALKSGGSAQLEFASIQRHGEMFQVIGWSRGPNPPPLGDHVTLEVDGQRVGSFFVVRTTGLEFVATDVVSYVGHTSIVQDGTYRTLAQAIEDTLT